MGSPVVEFSKDEDEKKKQKNAIVDKVLARLAELHIHLDLYDYGLKATQNSIYQVGMGIGFEFNCVGWEALKQRLERHEKFIRDDESTLLGCFMAAKTKGTGYRQKGPAESVHFQINRNSCDVHIDSHGVVDDMGQYSLVGMMAHLPWDLLPFLTKNHGYRWLAPNVLLAPTLGFSPSVLTRVQRFYEGGFKGGLPSMAEVAKGFQVGYDVQIMGHTRVGGVISYDDSYLTKIKPSLAFDTIGKYGRLSTQLSMDDVSAGATLNLSEHLKLESAFSKTFDSAEKADVKVKIYYQVGDW